MTEGDIVVVHDDALPCGFWKLGRIQEILTGRDGQPRAALVRVASRDRQQVVLRRPLQLLYLLEICEAENSDTGTEDAFTYAAIESPIDVELRDGPVSKEPERRPMCAAARRAN